MGVLHGLLAWRKRRDRGVFTPVRMGNRELRHTMLMAVLCGEMEPSMGSPSVALENPRVLLALAYAGSAMNTVCRDRCKRKYLRALCTVRAGR